MVACSLSDEPALVKQLQAGWVLRSEVRKPFGLERGVSALLKRWARGAGHIVERRNKGQGERVLYHLRAAVEGEDAGTLWDLTQAQT